MLLLVRLVIFVLALTLLGVIALEAWMIDRVLTTAGLASWSPWVIVPILFAQVAILAKFYRSKE
jgi:hypothetical protein